MDERTQKVQRRMVERFARMNAAVPEEWREETGERGAIWALCGVIASQQRMINILAYQLDRLQTPPDESAKRFEEIYGSHEPKE